jgi:hypothetical protein
MKLETAKTILRYAKKHIDLGQLRIAQTEEDWVYLPKEQVIGVALEITQDELKWNKWMVGYIEETFHYTVALENMEIFSLLHELGHHIKGNICSDEEYYMLTQQIEPGDNYSYRQIPDEKIADTFAIEFMQEHLNNILSIL